MLLSFLNQFGFPALENHHGEAPRVKTSNTAVFHQTPLSNASDYVRLVQFEQSDSLNPLRLSLKVCRFSGELTYNALSYEWGQSKASKLILVNNRPFFIRENLYNFLHVWRCTVHQEIPFFADAICINQDDITERNAQVQMMGSLYRQAKTVLVWLGHGNAESDVIFDYCNRPDAEPEEVDLSSTTKVENRMKEIHFCDRKALNKVYERSYWSRLWIIQELHLAQHAIIFCGNKSTPWSVFRRLPKSNSDNSSTEYGRHARSVLTALNKMATESLDELIIRFGSAGCSDDRDRVYGLLGIAHPPKNDRGLTIVADYSMSTAALFVRILSTLPIILQIDRAIKIFDILKLPTCLPTMSDIERAMIEIPKSVSNHQFSIKLTHLGHLGDNGKELLFNRNDQKYLPSRSEHEKGCMYSKGVFTIEPGRPQCVWAAHGGGPVLEMGPKNACVALAGPKKDDKVFLLEGTCIVLIAQKNILHTKSYEPDKSFSLGILVNQEDHCGISRASDLVNLFHRTLLTSASRDFREEKTGLCDVLYYEFSLREVVCIIALAGHHHDYSLPQEQNSWGLVTASLARSISTVSSAISGVIDFR